MLRTADARQTPVQIDRADQLSDRMFFPLDLLRMATTLELRRKDQPMEKLDLPQGTLDLLVLQMLTNGEMHGWGIAQRLNVLSRGALDLQEGTLYPALYRMEAKGWIAAEWAQSDNNRRAKYYRLTKIGRKQLDVEKVSWDRLASVIAAVMKEA